MPQNWDTSFACSGCLQASRGSHVYWFDVGWGKGPLRLTRLIEDLSALLDIASQGQGPRVLWRNAAVTLTRPYVSICFRIKLISISYGCHCSKSVMPFLHFLGQITEITTSAISSSYGRNLLIFGMSLPPRHLLSNGFQQLSHSHTWGAREADS